MRPKCTYAKLLDDPESTTAQGMRKVALEKADKIALRCLSCTKGTMALSVKLGCYRFHSLADGYSITSRSGHPGMFNYRHIEEEKEYRRVAEIVENEIRKLERSKNEIAIMRSAIWGAKREVVESRIPETKIVRLVAIVLAAEKMRTAKGRRAA